MKWFNPEPYTLDELKKMYRRLAMKHHPDIGGNTADMQQINAEYDILFARLKTGYNAWASANNRDKTEEQKDDFKRIIEILIKMDGLKVELCGSWLWIGGDTRKHKEALKAAGCQWCSKKKLWSWKPAGKRSHPYRGTKTMDQIRTKYGSQVIKDDDD